MFLRTLGISERQMRTVVRNNQFGTFDSEKRGGRQTVEEDEQLRDEVKQHINLFPRMESHYCRASSNVQYLSSDLNYQIMYDMYK